MGKGDGGNVVSMSNSKWTWPWQGRGVNHVGSSSGTQRLARAAALAATAMSAQEEDHEGGHEG